MQTHGFEDRWASPPPALRANADEVHVWRVFLDTAATAQMDSLLRVLSTDEVERAQQFQLKKDRDRFVFTRGTLRLLLSRYLACDPRELEFSYNLHGKPSLDESVCTSTLSFNLTHAGDLALIAITDRRRVGIDVEFIWESVELLSIAKNFFTPREYALLQTVPPSLQCAAFYNAWTRKEAYLKARGEGLSLLQTVEVTLLPGHPVEIVATSDDPEQARRWSLHSISSGIDYAGSLAVEGHDWRLLCYQW